MSEMPRSLWPDPKALGPVTDLYQLSMMAGYHAEGIDRQPATFELFVRRLPPGRGYLVWAGLGPAMADLLNLRFSDEQIAWLRSLPVFEAIGPEWFAQLATIRFTGDVWAMPEGSIAFANEPLLRVEAPLAEGQWVETFLLASLGYPTLAASKAARVVEAARGRALYDFGARRGHGPHASFLNAYATALAGYSGTSQVEAGRMLGLPVVGTMAHAWVQAFATEPEGFSAFARHFPKAATLLVDTYDTLQGVAHAAAIEPPVAAIRIDSGDLVALATGARALLDAAGRAATRIVASGDLNETKIDALMQAGAPIDGFGVGTDQITGGDVSSLAMVYKLVAVAGQGRVKRSPGKRTYPLAKQVWRQSDDQGRYESDLITAADEHADGEPMLVPIVRDGQWVGGDGSLAAARVRCAVGRDRLPAAYRSLACDRDFPKRYSNRLETEARRLGL